MKKFFAALLAVIMMLSLCVGAYAEGETAHTYKAYQIFSGRENSDGLRNVEWGEGIDKDAFLTALAVSNAFGETNPFAGCTSAYAVAQALSAFEDGSPEAKAFAKLAYANKAGDGTEVESGSTELGAGYYLIVDTTDVDGADDVVNLALLKKTSAGKVTFASKVEKPTVIKKVKEVNDSTGVTSEWQDAADHDMDDMVEFKLEAQLKTIEDYSVYKVVFHDTQSAGFDAPTDFVVTLQNPGKEAKTLTKDVDYTVATTDNDFTLTIDDVLASTIGAKNNAVITVTYKAKLNSGATLGSDGNPNEVYLEYSNNPNWTSSGSGDTTPTGETPEDKVIVFTYKLSVDKRDENKEELVGAGFTLYKYDAEAKDYVAVGEEIDGTSLAHFEWIGLDAGQYKLVETTVPTGYNAFDAYEFTIEATYEDEADSPELTALTSAGFGDDEGTNIFIGDLGTGELTGIVINEKGAVLPETGGIGTTIFYVAGSILAVGALILFITKKRMSAEG